MPLHQPFRSLELFDGVDSEHLLPLVAPEHGDALPLALQDLHHVGDVVFPLHVAAPDPS